MVMDSITVAFWLIKLALVSLPEVTSALQYIVSTAGNIKDLQTSLFPSLHCMPFFGPCPENGFLPESRKKDIFVEVKVYSLLLSCITLKQFCSNTYVKFSFLHAL
jgi:hypothetical protein